MLLDVSKLHHHLLLQEAVSIRYKIYKLHDNATDILCALCVSFQLGANKTFLQPWAKCQRDLQGATKREGYFPKGKWYNLFDNTTIDAHAGGKSVTLDLPMGQVGVHMPGGTILPMQQPALVTADVRASALTLLVALPHLQPLEAFADTHDAHQAADSVAHSALAEQHGEADMHAPGLQAQPGGRKVLASLAAQASMSQGTQGQAFTGVQGSETSQKGRATACGQVYMDDGAQLQVCRSGATLAGCML